MTLAAVLLAGGESRRMGRDKATLMIGGIPLWQRQAELLRTLSPEALLVSARECPAWLPPGTQFVPDAAPPRGPLGGLAAALRATPATHLLALPVDMPAMTAAHLWDLWHAASPGCGTLPALDHRTETLPAIYPTEAGPVAAALLGGEDVSLRLFNRTLLGMGWMATHTVHAAEAELYANCNSPADWEKHAEHLD